MTLRGESGRSRSAILAGSAPAVTRALKESNRWRPSEFTLLGAALVGPGDVPGLETLSRAPAWDALEFSGDADALILAETAPSRLAARHLLASAAGARLRTWIIENNLLRRLTLDDLVGRVLGEVDWTAIRALIAGKRVLITGGGGSIGSELARRVATLEPASLCVLDASEFNLFRISRELPKARVALADVRDSASMRRWFEREKPELVFHAAALKQVPLVEDHPCEGVLTNVLGTRNVADAAVAIGADLVFVSTDKAVNPSGAMGASKRLGELYCQALDRAGGSRALCARLGNVIGSTGSVTPVFESQLASGGPLTVTDAEVSRYFISIPQAADFILQAGAAGVGRDSARGAAFVLDMGEPLAVVDLARKIIQLEGLRPNIDVPITFVGLRAGEKLHEELVASDEWREPDPLTGVMAVASAERSLADLRETIERLTVMARSGDDAAVAAALHASIAAAAGERSDELAAVG